MDHKPNAIITFASGIDFCKSPGFNVFVNSIKKIEFKNDVIFLTNNMSSDVKKRLIGEGYQVWDLPDVHDILRDRWLALQKILCANIDGNNSRWKEVLFTDCRDVIFQANPFERDYNFTDEFVCLTCEGGYHRDSEWNSQDQIKFQANVKEFEAPFGTWRIINGGVVLGTMEALKNFALLVWATTLGSIRSCSDQAAINFIAQRTLTVDQDYFLSEPSRSNLCITGEGIKRGWIQPNYIDGKVCDKNHKPYHIFHQWDRTVFSDAILKEYQ